MVKSNILLIEDDFDIAQKLYNSTIGLQTVAGVELSTNLKDGIEKLYSTNYDIIVLDLNLPDGNGIELLKLLKEKNIATKTYVFSLSIELKKICLKLGAHTFFDKSTDFDYLIETLATSFKVSAN